MSIPKCLICGGPLVVTDAACMHTSIALWHCSKCFHGFWQAEVDNPGGYEAVHRSYIPTIRKHMKAKVDTEVSDAMVRGTSVHPNVLPHLSHHQVSLLRSRVSIHPDMKALIELEHQRRQPKGAA